MSEPETFETSVKVGLKLSKLDSPETSSKEHRKLQSCDYRGIVGFLIYRASEEDHILGTQLIY